jgi:hypothetical protein
MKTVFCKLLIILLAAASVPIKSMSQKSAVNVDKNSILIGEQVQLNYKFTFPPNATSVSIPLIEADSLTKSIEIISREKTDTLLSGKTITELSQKYTITSFDTGTHTIPPMLFSWYISGDTAPQTAFTDSLILTVQTVAADTTQPIKDIKAPWNIPFQWRDYLWHGIIGLIVLILIATAFYFYLRRRRGLPFFPEKVTPLLPPHEEAIQALDRIKKEKIWRSGMIKGYYTLLTDTLRRYIERRYGIQSLEMTTAETMLELKTTNADQQAQEKLKHILETADMVKFAKANPIVTENENCLDLAYHFVLSTKQTENEGQEDQHISKQNTDES